MIRLPILKDELAFLERLLPELQIRPDLGHLAVEIKPRIDPGGRWVEALRTRLSPVNCPRTMVNIR